MTQINPATAAARESARASDGTFGEQEHTAPEAQLSVLPDFRSARARDLDDKLAALRVQRDALMNERRDAHLLDIARHVPASVTRVTFLIQHDRDGDPHYLMFDHAKDEYDEAVLDPALTGYLYSVASDFGAPGDLVAGDWMDGDESYYWIDLDEGTALENACSFRNKMEAAQRLNGIAPLAFSDGHIAWTERAMRVRAQAAGITAIHFDVPEDAAGVRVVAFDHVDHGTIAPDDSDNDHMFLVGQGQQFPHRTDRMRPSATHPARFTLET